ncbi:MAG: hypothetical protein EXS52_00950 [Candidatus Staskawiczbacteria bacterium]|nr:hypothetical protein [Candidatus Staskawiczbacteria bacterium]
MTLGHYLGGRDFQVATPAYIDGQRLVGVCFEAGEGNNVVAGDYCAAILFRHWVAALVTTDIATFLSPVSQALRLFLGEIDILATVFRQALANPHDKDWQARIPVSDAKIPARVLLVKPCHWL